MKVLKLFLYGEDSIEDVKQIRLDALTALSTGKVIEWTSDSVTLRKVVSFPAEQIIEECNYFLRMYDPTIRANNPILNQTKPWLGAI